MSQPPIKKDRQLLFYFVGLCITWSVPSCQRSWNLNPCTQATDRDSKPNRPRKISQHSELSDVHNVDGTTAMVDFDFCSLYNTACALKLLSRACIHEKLKGSCSPLAELTVKTRIKKDRHRHLHGKSKVELHGLLSRPAAPRVSS